MLGLRRSTSAYTARVFVDDYVQGQLPGVCVESGVSTRSTLGYKTVIGSPSAAWYALLAIGPIGRRRYLKGRLPLSDATWHDIRQGHMTGIFTGLAAIVPVLLIPVLPDFMTPLFVVAAVALLVAGFFLYQRASVKLPLIELDASGRWVTMWAVHPAFVEAAARAESERETER